MKIAIPSLLVVCMAACGPQPGSDDSAGPDGGASSTTNASSGSSTLHPTGQGGTDTTAGSADTADETDTTSSSFIHQPDVVSPIECDIFEQDCPEGEKCMPWAHDGGSTWNATGCFPVAEDPDAPGEPCMVEGTNVSGIDTCELGAMCWDVDPETNEGRCIALCTGSPENPTCTDPDTTCVIPSDGALALCLPTCHPLDDPCPPDTVCVPGSSIPFTCTTDASGDMGQAGDPCELLNVCDPGLFCAVAEVVPDCVDSLGCCSAFCTLGDDSPCLPGQVCVPWFERGTTPPGYEDLGACVLP